MTYKIYFKRGWLIIDVGKISTLTNHFSLAVKQNSSSLTEKIIPTIEKGSKLFFSTMSIPIGEKQLLILGNHINLEVMEADNFDILSKTVSFIEQIGDQIFLTKMLKSDFQMIGHKSTAFQLVKIPALRFVDRVLLLQDYQTLNQYRNSCISQAGTMIHYNDGTNYFESSSDMPNFNKIETHHSFQVEVLHMYKDKMTIFLADNLKPAVAYIICNDTVIAMETNESELTIDFSQIDREQYSEAGSWEIQVLVDNDLLIGEMRFRESTMAINSYLVIANHKLQLLGDLMMHSLPSKFEFDHAGTMSIQVVDVKFGQLTLQSESITSKEQAVLVLKNQNKNIYNKVSGKFVDDGFNLIQFDLSLFMHHNSAVLTGKRWKLFMLTFYEGKVQVKRIINSGTKKALQYLNYGPVLSFSSTRTSTYDQKFEYYFNSDNELSLVKNSDSKLVIERFNIKSSITNIRRKNKLTYELDLQVTGESLSKLEIKHVIVVNRNKNSYSKIDLPSRIIAQTISVWRLKADFVMNTKELIPFYWDLYIEIEDEFGNESLIQIQNATKSVQMMIRKNVFKWQILSDSYLLAPYITVNKNLAFVFHPRQDFETPLNYFKEKMARVVEKLFRKQLKKKHIWITYEKNAMGAHDNAFTFFEYMYNNKKHDQFYYVIRRDSPEFKNLAGMDERVLKFMSLKYFIYMFAAELFISSDTKYHGYNLHQRDSYLGRRMARVKEVYLQHGVNGLKQVPAFHKKRGLLDFIIVPDEYEKKMVVKQWGYEPKQVAVTGLARWDKYVDLTGQIPFRQIFVMPTWRKWMDGMSEEEFVLTPFYKQYQTFLSSPRLKKLLIDNNTRIAFFLHPYFKDYVHLFNVDSSVIDRYGYLDVNMGEAIQKSSMMISDYSSVLWDMYYLKKPVLFYQFDQDEYLANEKSYMDYETELFGDVTFDSESTIDSIAYYVDNNFVEKPEYADLRQEFFTYMDHHNSERIYHAIRDNERRLGI